MKNLSLITLTLILTSVSFANSLNCEATIDREDPSSLPIAGAYELVREATLPLVQTSRVDQLGAIWTTYAAEYKGIKFFGQQHASHNQNPATNFENFSLMIEDSQKDMTLSTAQTVTPGAGQGSDVLSYLKKVDGKKYQIRLRCNLVP